MKQINHKGILFGCLVIQIGNLLSFHKYCCHQKWIFFHNLFNNYKTRLKSFKNNFRTLFWLFTQLFNSVMNVW